ncbi:MAG: nucleotidyltransferase domain-containing protein [Thermodesulfovibrionales bacterium]|nr:nucleotidyltransferase domain-containing protein [Thermodesulfovibrionales bacterium]
MVKEKYTRTEIKKLVKTLAVELEKNRIKVAKIILYGSYARGNPRAYSDIDIAIISPTFKGKPLLAIQEQLSKILSKYLAVVEPIGYSYEDFKTAAPETLLGEIKKSGKVLYSV